MFLKSQDFSIDQMHFLQTSRLFSLLLWYLDKNPSKQLNRQVKIIVTAVLNMYFNVFDEYRSCTFQITQDNGKSISLLFPPKVWKVFLCLHILKNQSLFVFKNAGFFIMVANRILLQLQIQRFFSWKIRATVKSYLYLPDKRQVLFQVKAGSLFFANKFQGHFIQLPLHLQ